MSNTAQKWEKFNPWKKVEQEKAASCREHDPSARIVWAVHSRVNQG